MELSSANRKVCLCRRCRSFRFYSDLKHYTTPHAQRYVILLSLLKGVGIRNGFVRSYYCCLFRGSPCDVSGWLAFFRDDRPLKRRYWRKSARTHNALCLVCDVLTEIDDLKRLKSCANRFYEPHVVGGRRGNVLYNAGNRRARLLAHIVVVRWWRRWYVSIVIVPVN